MKIILQMFLELVNILYILNTEKKNRQLCEDIITSLAQINYSAVLMVPYSWMRLNDVGFILKSWN